MATENAMSQQTVNTLKHAAYWGLGGAALVALAPLTVPTAALVALGGTAAAALGVSIPFATTVVGGIIGYNKPTTN